MSNIKNSYNTFHIIGAENVSSMLISNSNSSVDNRSTTKISQTQSKKKPNTFYYNFFCLYKRKKSVFMFTNYLKHPIKVYYFHKY